MRVVRERLLYVGDVVIDLICGVNSSIFSPILKAKLASNAVRNLAVKHVYSFRLLTEGEERIPQNQHHMRKL